VNFSDKTHVFSSLSISSIHKFHEEVKDISRSQIRSRLGGLIRDIFDYFLPFVGRRTAEQIRSKVCDLTDNIGKFLEELPLDLRDMQALRRMLSEKQSNILLPKKELNTLLQDIHLLFGRVYPRLKESPFSLERKMPKIVQDFLSPEMRRLRMEKQQDPTKTFDHEHCIQRKIAKGKLAITLGYGFTKNKGTTGTWIVKDINTKPVGVYKVCWKDVSWFLWIKKLFQSIGGGQLHYLSKKVSAQPQTERAAFILSRRLGFHIVPPCSLVTLKRLKGAFQVFIRKEKQHEPEYEYAEAQKVMEKMDSKLNFSEAENTTFQKFAIFDYLIGNLDRHDENWFITLSEENEIQTIKAIDNANSFPRKHPSKDAWGARNQYKWKETRLAQQTFTPQLIEFVQENLSIEKIKECLKSIKIDLPYFLDADMEALLMQRAAIILNIVKESEQTPAILANL
jgi:hypothetical protein